MQRIAIVTGGGKRVGESITRALLDDGWSVVAHVHHNDDAVPEGDCQRADRNLDVNRIGIGAPALNDYRRRLFGPLFSVRDRANGLYPGRRP